MIFIVNRSFFNFKLGISSPQNLDITFTTRGKTTFSSFLFTKGKIM